MQIPCFVRISMSYSIYSIISMISLGVEIPLLQAPYFVIMSMSYTIIICMICLGIQIPLL